MIPTSLSVTRESSESESNLRAGGCPSHRARVHTYRRTRSSPGPRAWKGRPSPLPLCGPLLLQRTRGLEPHGSKQLLLSSLSKDFRFRVLTYFRLAVAIGTAPASVSAGLLRITVGVVHGTHAWSGYPESEAYRWERSLGVVQRSRKPRGQEERADAGAGSGAPAETLGGRRSSSSGATGLSLGRVRPGGRGFARVRAH